MTTTLVSPAPSRLPGPVAALEAAPREYHWTADKFYQAANAGVFENPGQLELIHGRIIEKMPQGSLHRATRLRIARLLRGVLEPALAVADECPIHIAFDGEPIPDIVALRGAAAENLVQHPSPADVALLVEIAVSSAEYDLRGKALLYAQAGVTDYWVVLPEAGELLVHRDPTPQGYASVARLAATDTLAPLAASSAILSMRDLLGLAATEEETP